MARIAVVGSVACDDTVLLQEPLRPGTHLEGTASGSRMGGGAANTGLALAHAGHVVHLLAALGADESGEWLMGELARAGVRTGAITRVAGPSTRSLVLIDPAGERTVINLHREVDLTISGRLRDVTVDAVYVRSRALDLASALELQCGRARLVAAHVPPSDTGARPAHGLVGSASDFDPAALADPWTFGQRVAGPHLRWIVVTRGADGASAYTEAGALHVPAPRIRARDTTGAGDAFASGLLHALLDGAPLETAMETATRWGAEAALTPGSVLPRECVHKLLRESQAQP